VPPSAAPHSMQNFAPGGFSAPHEGQSGANACPQDMQKRALSGFCVPQLGHSLTCERLRPRRRPAA
jgi:hypothetical protein